MLFNSTTFLFGFLPIVLAGFLLLKLRSLQLALGWLILSSIVFYAWWRPWNLLIIGPSLIVNFTIARALMARNTDAHSHDSGRWLLTAGIVFNVCVLGYFKYANFVRTIANDIAGTDFVLQTMVLPLGISFITFQLIAFLVDVHGGRIKSCNFRDFCLFVLFFPQLIAGPIVHYREMMPQFKALPRRPDREALAVGLTLLGIGLFKKIVLADGLAAHVTPIYTAAAGGAEVTLLWAWIAALGFTLQIYFDFSAYSDMAAGLARSIGPRLPMNFFSPLKATSIIDFWARWHITLTRFLTAYVYNPITLWLNRRRLSRNKELLNPRRPALVPFLYLLALPTLLTMFVSGLWHGAAYLFVLWGLLHGIYLVVNHGWRMAMSGDGTDSDGNPRLKRTFGFVLTFLAVVVAMVLFRGPTPQAAQEVLFGLVGLNGVSLPDTVLQMLGPTAQAMIASDDAGAIDLILASAWVLALTAIALLAPNSLQLVANYKPVLEDVDAPGQDGSLTARLFRWRPSFAWAVIVGGLIVAAVMRLGGESEFLYWQF